MTHGTPSDHAATAFIPVKKILRHLIGKAKELDKSERPKEV